MPVEILASCDAGLAVSQAASSVSQQSTHAMIISKQVRRHTTPNIKQVAASKKHPGHV